MATASSPRLLTLHAFRLKGVAQPEAVADATGLPLDVVRAEIGALCEVDLVTYRSGRMPGYMQTPEGRVHGSRLLASELDESGTREVVAAAYHDFLGCNQDLLGVCTAWQLRPVDGVNGINDHSDQDYDDSVRRWLTEVHGRVDPILVVLSGALDRFSGHRRRLGTALERVVAGDNDYFTKPMFPSYHSNWFELHEDLLATLGTERATEGSH